MEEDKINSRVALASPREKNAPFRPHSKPFGVKTYADRESDPGVKATVSMIDEPSISEC